MRVTPREPIEAHQYIYPSSTQQIAHALGGMVDRSGNLWLDLDDGGVQQVEVGCWIICRGGRPETTMTRAEVQDAYEPLDWQEAQRALGGTRWTGDPDASRSMVQGTYGPSYT